MIEEIEISNFRGFSKPVTVRLRPITILIGKNSAGKSSVMKLLLLIRQTLESYGGGFFPSFFETEGRHVELGAIDSLQCRNPGFYGKRLKLRMQLRTPEGPSGRMLELIGTLKNGARKADEENSQIQLIEDQTTLGALDQETTYDIRVEMLYRRPAVGRHIVTATQEGKQIFQLKSSNLKDIRFLSFRRNTSRPEGELELLANNSFLRPARQLLSAVRHLSPVREDDSRKVVERANPPADEVGHFGEHTIYHLYRILNREGAKADFVKDSIQRIANIDDLEFRKQAREFTSHFRGRNVDTGARCYLKEFGFGVSQCIPIFVQGVLLQKGQLLMVEQPEAQLHPTAQLELGSFFADLWRQFGVPSLVETHSDNLFLRLRKLVRQKKLPSSDVSIAYFCVEDRAVSVKNLDIMDDGRIGAGLPMEFFGADLLEVLDMH